jgi:hypothetical protein
MSQFRKTGINYVSQFSGDDANAGTDPLLPKKNPSAITVTTLTIVGAGQYTRPTIVNENRNFEGDGKVVFDNYNFNSGSSTITMRDIYFRNSISGTTNNFTDCCWEGGSISLRGTKLRTKILGLATIVAASSGSFANGIIEQSVGSPVPTYTQPITFTYTYVGSNSIVIVPAAALAGFQNNMVNGRIALTSAPTTYYESKLLFDGSPRPDADPGIADIVTVFANFYTQGNYSGDPKFIDVVSGKVEPDSDLLLMSNANGYIGGVKVGKKIDLDESGFTITKTGIDDSNPNFWKIATGQPYAKIRITGKVSDSLISAQTLDIRIPFNFDGDAVGGTANNNNVPDAWNARTTPDTKGTKPNRLTFEVRSSTLTNPGRDVSADWDNDNTNSPSIAGQYYLMEYGQVMLHHIISAVAYGNADSLAINAATKIPFNYRSLDIIITITNTRVI